MCINNTWCYGYGIGVASFIAGYIAYSIADRPGIAPGFLMGQIASFLGAGFLGEEWLVVI